MVHLTSPDAGASPLASTHLFDVTIIGGGPVGLFAAFYAGLRQMSAKIIDSLEELGGQLTALYPEKYVFDVPGFAKIYARDLAKNLIEQAMEYRPTISLGETVKTLTPLKIPADAADAPPEIQGVVADGQTVYRITSNQATHYTRTLIIAAGAGAFAPRKLTHKDAPALENRGLYYSCKSKSLFANKRILIAGGGDSAIDWALNLRETAFGGDGSGITLIHRSNKFRAHEDSVRKLQVTKTRILTFREIQSFITDRSAGGGGHLKAVTLINKETNQTQTLEVDAILVQFGFISSLGAIKDWPVQIEKSSIRVNHIMETALPGVFAVGDVATFEKPEAKLRLIATGFGEAALAVCHAKTRIDPHAKIFPGHSSEMTPQASSSVTV